MNYKGVTLLLVLSLIIVFTLLANIATVFISNQSDFTERQVARIQAFYAAQAGMNYALEKLRLGGDPNWPTNPPAAYTHNLCRGCVAPDIDEPALPSSVQSVAITVDDEDGDNILEIHSTAIY